MIAVIFEVWPKPGHKQQYLDLAAALRPLLERIDGFISIERFESLSKPGKLLSLSFFRDEAAIAGVAESRSSPLRPGQRTRRGVRRLSITDRRRDQGLRHVRARAGPVRQPRHARLKQAEQASASVVDEQGPNAN